jgi:hypothetical protein
MPGLIRNAGQRGSQWQEAAETIETKKCFAEIEQKPATVNLHTST